MSTNLSNRKSTYDAVKTTSSLKIEGSVVVGDQGKISTYNGSIYSSGGDYLGNFNYNRSDSDTNMGVNVKDSHLSEAHRAIFESVSEIETELSTNA